MTLKTLTVVPSNFDANAFVNSLFASNVLPGSIAASRVQATARDYLATEARRQVCALDLCIPAEAAQQTNPLS